MYQAALCLLTCDQAAIDSRKLPITGGRLSRQSRDSVTKSGNSIIRSHRLLADSRVRLERHHLRVPGQPCGLAVQA
jgi:hypothetical protein